MSYMTHEETSENGVCTLKIVSDDDPQNPREFFDHAGTMVCFHHKYTLGDKTHYDFKQGFELWPDKDTVQLYVESLADSEFLTVEQYMESYYPGGWLGQVFENEMGFWSNCNDLSLEDAPWFARAIVDNGGVVLPLFLYDHGGITMSTGAFCCSWDSGQVGFIYITKEKMAVEGWDKEHATKYLQGEVEEYDQYLTGDVWGYVVEADDGTEVESCWGFYGVDYCKSEGQSVFKSVSELIAKERAAVL